MKMQKSKGFTLIELMIVIAIIGVLMAIAIPQYQKYVIRSKAGQAVNAFRPIQNTIDEWVALQRRLPDPAVNGRAEDFFVYTAPLEMERATCSGIVQQVDVQNPASYTINAGGASTIDVLVTFYGAVGATTEDGAPPAALGALPTECQNNQVLNTPAQLAGRTVVFRGTHNQNSTTVNWAIVTDPTTAVPAVVAAPPNATFLVQTYLPVFTSL